MSARATDNYNGRKACPHTGKRRYRKRKQGLSGAGIVSAAYGVKVDTYKCRMCGDWHLTEIEEHGDRRGAGFTKADAAALE